MGDMGDTFRAMKEHNQQEREKKSIPRLEYAMKNLSEYNYKTEGCDKIIIFLDKGTITFYPYTGWFQGQKPFGKVRGRGIQNLLIELERIK